MLIYHNARVLIYLNARVLIYQNARVGGNGRHNTDDDYYITPIAYDRNTSILMRLEVNYLVIAPPTFKCSTAWIVQASVMSWTLQTNE